MALYEALNRNSNHGNQVADCTEGANYVLSVNREILAHHMSSEQLWHTKKLKMHQKLALRLFQEDVRQVNCFFHYLPGMKVNITCYCIAVLCIGFGLAAESW